MQALRPEHPTIDSRFVRDVLGGREVTRLASEAGPDSKRQRVETDMPATVEGGVGPADGAGAVAERPDVADGVADEVADFVLSRLTCNL